MFTIRVIEPNIAITTYRERHWWYSFLVQKAYLLAHAVLLLKCGKHCETSFVGSLKPVVSVMFMLKDKVRKDVRTPQTPFVAS